MDSISTITQRQIYDLRTASGQDYLEHNPMLSADIPPGVKGYDMGIAGDAVPYAISNDNIIPVVLLGCFIFTVIAVARSRRLIDREIKNLFTYNRDDEVANEMGSEQKYQIVMVLIGVLLMALSSYLYATDAISPSFMVKNHYVLIGMFSGMFFSYFLFYWFSTSVVNMVFFGSKKNAQWMQTKLSLTTAISTLMLPVVLLQVYFDFSARNALLWFIFILILNKLLTFYKCWTIFFRQKGGLLQTFLYFCALEMMPLLALGVIWLSTVNNLKVNF